MKDDDDTTVIDAWLIGPEHALERIPIPLRIAVVKRILAKLEKANAPKRPTRRYRKKSNRRDVPAVEKHDDAKV